MCRHLITFSRKKSSLPLAFPRNALLLEDTAPAFAASEDLQPLLRGANGTISYLRADLSFYRWSSCQRDSGAGTCLLRQYGCGHSSKSHCPPSLSKISAHRWHVKKIELIGFCDLKKYILNNIQCFGHIKHTVQRQEIRQIAGPLQEVYHHGSKLLNCSLDEI